MMLCGRSIPPVAQCRPGRSSSCCSSFAFLSIGAGPHGRGQSIAASPSIAGLHLDLPPQITAGALSYEVFLRGFADGSRDIVELKNIGSIRLNLSGPAVSLSHPFASPLQTDITSRYDEVSLTFEINLSWRPDPGSGPLALSRNPVADRREVVERLIFPLSLSQP
jgi:hypothetical protein